MALVKEFAPLLHAAYNASTTEKELEALDSIRNLLLPNGNVYTVGPEDEEDLEREWLSYAQLQDQTDDENPFPGFTLETQLVSQTDLQQFVFYVFHRRFGWSETGQDVQRMKKVEQALTKAKNKIYINDHLDGFLKWIQWHSISLPLLSSLIHCIKQAGSKPVVRNQTIIHSMDWMQSQTSKMTDEHYPVVKSLVLLGITDVWSAIRNACVARLSHLLEMVSVPHLHDFFDGLVAVCQLEGHTWQAKEGAVMGINLIVRHFQWITQLAVEELDEQIEDDQVVGSKANSPQQEYFLQFGPHQFRGMPSFITDQMRRVIFPLLADPQLSIREHAIKAFSSFLGRCEFKGALSAFRDVVLRLCRGTGVEDLDNYHVLPHVALLSPEYVFMDAYEAEGLLGVCVFLVKHIPPGHLLPSWPLYFSTFSLYLSHPASTVRQATSSIFKFLVARDSHSPVMLKLVLQGLSDTWIPDREDLKSVITFTSSTESTPCNTNDGHQRGIVKRPSFRGQAVGRRMTITKISGHEGGSSSLSQAWEWREGRLLAYELILKFLIKNHWLYTFGPPHLCAPWNVSAQASVTSPRLDPGASADQAFFSREREPLSRQSSSFGGTSLHTALHRTSSEKLQRSSAQPTLSSSPKTSLITPTNTSSTATCWPQTQTKETLPEIEEENISPPVPRLRIHSISSNPAPFSASSCIATDETLDVAASASMQLHVSWRPRNSICTSSPTMQLPQYSQHNNWSSQMSCSMGASEASNFRLQSSRLSAVGDSFASQRTLVRHYSFFMDMQQGGAVVPTPSAIPGDHSLNHALSLLMHTLATDIQMEKKIESKEEKSLANGNTVTGEAAVTSIRRLSLGEATDSQCVSWLGRMELSSLATILEDILYQTIESLADVRWELRRMGQQLLPCVVEVLRWYDMAVLEKLWVDQLEPVTSTLVYGSCLALKYSIAHTAKLLPMLHTVPTTWQDPEMCREVVQRITVSVIRNIPQCLTVVHSLLQRPQLDKLTVVAMEILMVAHSHFALPSDKKWQQTHSILTVILEIFAKSHPDLRLGGELLLTLTTDRTVLTAADGFLSCCTRLEGPQQSYKQVEKHMLEELHTVLVPYLQGAPVKETACLLPVLAAQVRVYADNDTFLRAIIDSVGVLGVACNNYLKSGVETNNTNEVHSFCLTALRELSEIISQKDMEANRLRQVLELYYTVCNQVEPTSHLPVLLRAVCVRNTAGTCGTPSGLAAYHDHVETSNTDLTILSNDIPVLATPPPDIPSDSDEEGELNLPTDGLLQESHLLDVSGNSSNPSGHQSHASGSVDGRIVSPALDTSEGGGSDWDSWSDEDEQDNSAVSAILREFLQRFQQPNKSCSQSGGAHLQSVLRLLSSQDRRIIETIIQDT